MSDLSNLERDYTSLREGDPRSASEHAYALASLYLKNGDRNQAVRYGRESLELLEGIPGNTLEECAARNTVLAGIAIPDIFHQEVVRERLSCLSL